MSEPATSEQSLFFCHASEDAEVASALAEMLESHSHTCWIAPRDVSPSGNYARAIVAAIRECGVFVVLLSRRSAASPHVQREIEYAVSGEKPLLVLRAEQFELPDELRYYLATTQWLDLDVRSLRTEASRISEIVGLLKNQPSYAAPGITSLVRPSLRSLLAAFKNTQLAEYAYAGALLLLIYASSILLDPLALTRLSSVSINTIGFVANFFLFGTLSSLALVYLELFWTRRSPTQSPRRRTGAWVSLLATSTGIVLAAGVLLGIDRSYLLLSIDQLVLTGAPPVSWDFEPYPRETFLLVPISGLVVYGLVRFSETLDSRWVASPAVLAVAIVLFIFARVTDGGGEEAFALDLNYGAYRVVTLVLVAPAVVIVSRTAKRIGEAVVRRLTAIRAA